VPGAGLSLEAGGMSAAFAIGSGDGTCSSTMLFDLPGRVRCSPDVRESSRGLRLRKLSSRLRKPPSR